MYHVEDRLSGPEEDKEQLEYLLKETDVLELMNRYAGTHRRRILS